MGFSLKKSLKKLEKTVKKVAPAALTVINPALGATYAAAQKTYTAIKSARRGTSGEVQLISNAGYTGMTTPEGITEMTGPESGVGEKGKFDAWARGGYGKSVGQTLKSPIVMVGLAVGVLVLLFVIVRRK